ncbi:hypothetical protein niasHT_034909 [Heterodera trifolii]|uniref:Uncharacterized protein n=1 Tax=Heterodera trifolii TaxID=157864 RepID=A0ABD2I2Y4_9BILA
MSTTWEISQNCPISCPESYHCFEPTEFTAPHLCLPPGVTPNSFRHYISFREENAVMIFGAILLSGLALGWLICFLFLCFFPYCFRPLRRLTTKRRCGTHSGTSNPLADSSTLRRPANTKSGVARPPPPLALPFSRPFAHSANLSSVSVSAV